MARPGGFLPRRFPRHRAGWTSREAEVVRRHHRDEEARKGVQVGTGAARVTERTSSHERLQSIDEVHAFDVHVMRAGIGRAIRAEIALRLRDRAPLSPRVSRFSPAGGRRAALTAPRARRSHTWAVPRAPSRTPRCAGGDIRRPRADSREMPAGRAAPRAARGSACCRPAADRPCWASACIRPGKGSMPSFSPSSGQENEVVIAPLTSFSNALYALAGAVAARFCGRCWAKALARGGGASCG